MKQEKIARQRPSVMSLHDISAEEALQFGAKTAGLVAALEKGAPVYPGIAISVRLASRIAASRSPERYLKLLAPHIERMIERHGATSFIVRSSSIYEDLQSFNFPGVFDSYSDLKTTEQVVSGICKIVQNSRAAFLDPYFEKAGISRERDHMAVLIQPMASPSFGGVLRYENGIFEIEYTSDEIASAIAGKKRYSTAQFDGRSVRILAQQKSDQRVNLKPLIKALSATNDFWSAVRDNGLTIEFFAEERGFFVAQAKHLRALSEIETGADDQRLLSDGKANKTVAMRFFDSHNLFDMPLVILDCGWTLADVQKSADSLLSSCSAITVRLSRAAEIGLPRAFCSSLDETLSFVQSYAPRSCDLILHGYINVERSLEVIIDQDGYLIEHVPGMWESPNTLQPDVILSNRGDVTSYRYNSPRQPEFDSRTLANQKVAQPLGDAHLQRLNSFGERLWAAVTSSFSSDIPLNVHAVCDADFGNFQCLNIRPGFELSDVVASSDQLLRIASLKDLKGWTIDQPVRLSLSLNRGDERTLIPLAEKLSDAVHPIVIDFGMLSHPAMILRERGCKLVPSYKVPGCLPSDIYTIQHDRVDVGTEPVDRILREEPVINNSVYHVVTDREPIVPAHIIGLAKKESSSVTDTGAIQQVLKIIDQFGEGSEVFFFEKGRSEFCTSVFTHPRDHFHALKGADFSAALSELNRQVGGQHFENLEEAYRAVPRLTPYIVYGCQTFGYFLVLGHGSSHKRLLRSVF